MVDVPVARRPSHRSAQILFDVEVEAAETEQARQPGRQQIGHTGSGEDDAVLFCVGVGQRRLSPPAQRFERGPLFANVVLADEINRATPRTQSALLEAMEERQVTVFGDTMPLEEPFSVIATQNPIEMEGTYSLPEAQLDRFICKIELLAPAEKELIEILASTTGPKVEVERNELEAIDLFQMRSFVRQVPGSADIIRWVARTIRLTDPRNESAPESVRRNLRYGASPRGGQSILLLAKARALVEGRPWINEGDVDCVTPPALRHRLVFGYEGEASGIHADEITLDALNAAR